MQTCTHTHLSIQSRLFVSPHSGFHNSVWPMLAQTAVLIIRHFKNHKRTFCSIRELNTLSKGARSHACAHKKIKIPKHSDMMRLIESEWEEWQEGAFSWAAALKERHSANEINVFRLWWGHCVLIHSSTIQHVAIDLHVFIRSTGWRRCAYRRTSLTVSKRHKKEKRQWEQGRGGTDGKKMWWKSLPEQARCFCSFRLACHPLWLLKHTKQQFTS